MFSFFKAQPVLSESDTTFQIATYKWLLQHFGGADFYERTQLILPTSAFFPTHVSSATEAVTATFEAIKKHANMQDWPCQLIAQEQDIDPQMAATTIIQNVPSNPLGTFQNDLTNNQVVITYNPNLIQQPTRMVATLAHELAHYLTSTAPEPPPGGWDNWEFVTDITATFLGFGIFMANSAFEFQQFSDVDSQGWRSSRNGYLTETEHCFALAIFLNLRDIPLSQAQQHLKPSLKKLLTLAHKQVLSRNIIDELKDTPYQGLI